VIGYQHNNEILINWVHFHQRHTVCWQYPPQLFLSCPQRDKSWVDSLQSTTGVKTHFSTQ